MGSHPLNLALRFLLELVALFGLGAWGWYSTDSAGRFLLVLGVPLLAAAAWSAFAVPDDPSRSGRAPVAVPGWVRLALEILVLGGGALALHHAGFERAGLVFAVLAGLHYAISYDRIAWLLRR